MFILPTSLKRYLIWGFCSRACILSSGRDRRMRVVPAGSFSHVEASSCWMRVLTSPVLVTGISPKSIGEGVALALAAHRPDLLILASRTLSKIQAVTHSIHVSHAHVKIQEVVVDLSSLKSVRAAAESCREILGNEGRRLDVLF